MKYVMLLTLFQVACGQPRLEVGGFEYYLEKFELEALKHYKYVITKDLKIRMVDKIEGMDKPGIVGLCSETLGFNPNIQILRSYWEAVNETEREMLIYHELGHCILGRNHSSYNGIMSATLRPYQEYLEHREEYIVDLFK